MKKSFFASAFSFLSVLACGQNYDRAPSDSVATANLTMEAASSASSHAGFPRVVGVSSSLHGSLLRTEVTVSASSHPLDRFRFQKTIRLGREPKAYLFLLPSRNCNSAEYEWSDSGTFEDSFVGYLAQNGVEVWGFAPRTSNLSENYCLSNDCSVAKSWGLESYVQDIDFMRSVFGVLHPHDSPVIGGLSLGTILGYASISARPRGYAGLIAWENAILSKDAAFKAGFASVCAADEQALAEGKYVDDNFGSLSRLALRLFQSNPEGASPLPFFPGFNNRQAFVGLFSLPAPGVPIPQRGFVIQAGDPVAGYFTYTNFYRATKMLEVGNYYESQRLIRDFDCSFSGAESRFSKNLKSFTGPILLIKEGLGFGEYADDSVAATGSKNITRISHSQMGHADSFLSISHRTDIDHEILRWLNEH